MGVSIAYSKCGEHSWAEFLTYYFRYPYIFCYKVS